MKPKSTLRSFLAMAGSSLLTITYVSGTPETYYWDSDDDAIAGFGTTAGTWSSGTPTNANKWSTSPTGNGVGGAAAANVVTDTEDDLFFGTGPTGATPPLYNYTGTTAISGTVSAKSIYDSANHGAFSATATPVLNFGTAGTWDSAKANNTLPAMAITGAATSLTWKVPYSSNLNIGSITSNAAAQNILQGPGKLVVNGTITSSGELGVPGTTVPPVAGTPLVFDGGILRMATGFNTYLGAAASDYSLSGLNAKHPVTFNLNRETGFDNQITLTTFTVDQALSLGTGGFTAEGRSDAFIALTQTNNYSGATKLISSTLVISDAGNIGTASAPFYFNTTLKITGTGMTSLGSRTVVIKGGSTMKLNIEHVDNVFTVGQSLTDNDLVSPDGADGIPLGALTDIAGTCGVAKSGEGTLVLSGTNSHTGLNTIANGGGILRITNPSALGTGTVTISTNGAGTGTLELALTGTNSITNTFTAFGSTAPLTSVTPGTAHIRNTSGTNTITSNLTTQGSGGSNGMNVVSNGGLLTLSGGITNVTSLGSINLGGTGNGVVSGAITDTIAGLFVIKSGAGTWTLSNASSAYTGVTSIRGGTLIAGANAPSGSAGAFGNATSEIPLGVASGNDAASILTGGAFTIGRNIRNNSTDVADAGTRVLTLGGNSAHDSVFSGNIFLGIASRPSKGIQLSAVAGGQVTFSGVIQNPSGQDVTEAAAAAALTAVTKVGLGTVVLSNANLYTGATTVSDGTLTVNGSLADASLSIASTAVVNGTGALTFNIDGATADQVVNGGTINVSGLTVAVNATGAGLTLASYVLVDATGGGLITGTFAGVTGAPGYVLDYGTANQVKLVQTAGSPYDTWATTKGLTGLAGSSTDPAKTADPDNDGRNNLGEFAFNGNPTSGSDNGKVYMLTEDSDDGDAIKELILTVAVRTGTPAFAGSPSPSAIQASDAITYSIEGSLDLASFPTTVNVVSPVITGLPADPGAGYEYRSFSLNGSNGLTGKGFLRAKVTSP